MKKIVSGFVIEPTLPEPDDIPQASSRPISLFELDLFGELVSAFQDHALESLGFHSIEGNSLSCGNHDQANDGHKPVEPERAGQAE